MKVAKGDSFDPSIDAFHGDVFNTRDVITFQGRSVEKIKLAMKDSVEDYLLMCEEDGADPEKPFSGKFQFRGTPELHRRLAARRRTSMNTVVREALEKFLDGPADVPGGVGVVPVLR